MDSPQPIAQLGVSPIFGKRTCLFISDGGHITLPDSDFIPPILNGFSLAIDVQTETKQSAFLLGTGVSSRTSLIVQYNVDGVRNRIGIEICDDAGRMLCASAQLSHFAAKRIFITANLRNNIVCFYEFNLLTSEQNLETKYTRQESPHTFSHFQHKMIIGGACIDGNIQGTVSAKIANIALWRTALNEQHVKEIFDVSRREIELFNANNLYPVAENPERRAFFKDDMGKLREWAQKSHLSGADTREAANMLYRWLLDKHPMLQDLCNELGIQLTLPGGSKKIEIIIKRNYSRRLNFALK